MTLGRWGIALTDVLRTTHPDGFATVLSGLERAGVGTVWFGENVGGEAFVTAGLLLARSTTLTVAPGVANVAARAPAAMEAGRRLLAGAYPGRVALGIGISHDSIVAAYGAPPIRRPLRHLASYLDAMDDLPGPRPDDAPVLVAALGPRMLALVGERGLGVHAWNVQPEHTAAARASIGSGPPLAPRHAALISADRAIAHEVGRAHLAKYLGFPNYRRAWLRQGFREVDVSGQASDRLVDAMVAWGTQETVVARLTAHHDAGADHVAVHALPRPGQTAAEAALELAPLLPT